MIFFSLLFAVAVFIGFMSLVGSPSEVETIIGLIFGAVAFLFALVTGWRMKSNSHEDQQSAKIAALEKELEALKAKK